MIANNLGVESIGYYYNGDTVTSGSQVPNTRIGSVSGHRVDLAFPLQDQTTLQVKREARRTPVDFIGNLLAVVPSVLGVFGIFVKNYYSTNPPRARTELESQTNPIHTNPIQTNPRPWAKTWDMAGASQILLLMDTGVSYPEAKALMAAGIPPVSKKEREKHSDSPPSHEIRL